MPQIRKIAQPRTRISARHSARVPFRLGASSSRAPGGIASSTTLLVAQIAFTTLRSPLIRAAIALLFAVPAAVAGYHAALGLAHIAIPVEGWREAMAAAGAIIVAATAWTRIVLFAPPDAGQGIAAGLTWPNPLASQAKEG
jgi:hypothetical protein